MLIRRIEEVLASGRVFNGPAVRELELRLAYMTGRRHAVTVNSGTDALHFALAAAGIGAGDEVLVPDFSFVSSASSVLLAGAQPVFVDIEESYNMSLEKSADRCCERSTAIVFVHLYGQMSNPTEIEAFARRHNLVLIEDAAQAIGATFEGRPAGSLGAASCLSFNSTKTISSPSGGGAVLTDDDAIADRVRRLRSHGRAEDGSYVELGRFSMMPTASAAILNFKLDHDDVWQQRRQEVVRYFRERWQSLPDPSLPLELPGARHTYHKFVVRDRARADLALRLRKAGVETGVHYPVPLHRMPVFGGTEPDADDAAFPCATACTKSVLTIPAHHCLSDTEVDLIADVVENAAGG